VLGGLAGGFVGGLLFDPIGSFFSIVGVQSGTISRLVGLVALGAAAGIGIGLVEEFRKEAWLLVVDGPLAGKQFIIYKSPTVVGSAAGVDIPLMKDKLIAPKQCALSVGRGAHVLQDLGTRTTMVNDAPVDSCVLRSGDLIQMGATTLQYQARALSAGPLYGE
jgi:hypothetical protein